MNLIDVDDGGDADGNIIDNTITGNTSHITKTHTHTHTHTIITHTQLKHQRENTDLFMLFV
jgi:hypothetical protein